MAGVQRVLVWASRGTIFAASVRIGIAPATTMPVSLSLLPNTVKMHLTGLALKLGSPGRTQRTRMVVDSPPISKKLPPLLFPLASSKAFFGLIILMVFLLLLFLFLLHLLVFSTILM